MSEKKPVVTDPKLLERVLSADEAQAAVDRIHTNTMRARLDALRARPGAEAKDLLAWEGFVDPADAGATQADRESSKAAPGESPKRAEEAEQKAEENPFRVVPTAAIESVIEAAREALEGVPPGSEAALAIIRKAVGKGAPMDAFLSASIVGGASVPVASRAELPTAASAPASSATADSASRSAGDSTSGSQQKSTPKTHSVSGSSAIGGRGRRKTSVGLWLVLCLAPGVLLLGVYLVLIATKPPSSTPGASTSSTVPTAPSAALPASASMSSSSSIPASAASSASVAAPPTVSVAVSVPVPVSVPTVRASTPPPPATGPASPPTSHTTVTPHPSSTLPWTQE